MRPHDGPFFLPSPMLLVKVSDHSRDETVIEARSNLSMSLDRLTAVFGGICVLTLLIAAWPVFFGLWPILLAAVLHLLIVGWCFRAAWRGNWARERLLLEREHLVLEEFRLGRQQRSEWPAAWTRVETRPARNGDLHVYLCAQGQRREVGSFLPVNERQQLGSALRSLLAPHSALVK